jgi:hypothetical protein
VIRGRSCPLRPLPPDAQTRVSTRLARRRICDVSLADWMREFAEY